ncbi:phage major capsid protein [Marinitenerispora sediminis]|uniref:Phage major capsid protein n=1 Tax=Marinitenerispora sediminis TaxID=1931232 RepID=A0A368T6F4_9ACTN|nr:phage major capsid protein [Marinitenerispora sediminis]RCV53475.1 phage major capsid protein [Marinitenerispora sediminis]RCV59303.1 phage major capsid protein [Marinitenerispora sediminis]
MAGIDINRTTQGVYLPPAVSSEIWQDAQEASIVMQLARRIDIPGRGVSIPIITGDPTAEWVAETDEKPVSRGTLSNKTLTPYKLAVIEPFSMEFRRDLPTLYSALRGRLVGAIARLFDETVLFGPSPGTGFDTLAGVPEIDLSGGFYDGLVQAIVDVSAANGDVSAWVFDGSGEGLALQAKDNTGRPLFISNLQSEGRSIGTLLGRPAYKSRHVSDGTGTVGFAGDWSSAMYGMVTGISISESDQATLTDSDGTVLNLWQRNMFAIRAELEIGFALRDEDRFVRLTNGGS